MTERTTEVSIEILMPALAPSMTEGSIARWLKTEGERIVSGEPLVEIETDKAVVEYESPHSGIVARIVVAAGSANVAVDQVIALLEPTGEENSTKPGATNDSTVSAATTTLPTAPSAGANTAPISREVVVPPVAPIVGTPAVAVLTIPPFGSRIPASPLARRLAAARNIDLAVLKGSGPGGRVVKRDVDAAGSSVAEIPVPAATGKTIPHFYLTIDCRIDALLSMRKELNHWSPGAELSINDFIIKAVALMLRRMPEVNASWSGSAIRRHQTVDVAFAVSAPAGGITPIIRDADRKGLAQISTEMRTLAERGRQGGLTAEECQGGGFTISNLGKHGVREFAAVVNPPQSCLLAIGAGEQRPVVTDGVVGIATLMTCTLSTDQRVIGGELGAEFLAAFKRVIEQPLRMTL